MRPAKLQKGDTIAFIAPSSGLSNIFPHRIDNAKKFFLSEGYKVKEYPTTRGSHEGSSGTIKDRLRDLDEAFSDKEVKAIICTVGGISSNELISKIDYNLIKKNPKIFCGFSDISILHYAFLTKTGLVTFYGPALMGEFGECPNPQDYTLEHFYKAVTNKIGKIKSSEMWVEEFVEWNDQKEPRNKVPNKGFVWLKPGKVKGKIIGGCLYSILQLMGTEYNVDYNNKILFIETAEGEDYKKGEPLDLVSSKIMDLRNAGVFDKIKGLVVGRPFGYTSKEREKFKDIIKKHIENYDFPVLINFDIGHTSPMITIPLNIEVEMDSIENRFEFLESGVD